MVKICVGGSAGRMGLRISALAKDDADVQVSGEYDIGQDAAPLIGACDCLIEFTSPAATMEHLALCRAAKKAIVIGTTGLSDEERQKVQEAAAEIPVVFSPNMSVGVNLLFKIVKDAAKTLGREYHVSMVEAHHVNKKDAPSGTAKELAAIVKGVEGDVEIPIESVREEDIVGEHTITFESGVDLIEITHSAKTRDIFAKGAIQAAKWVAGKKPGLYTMQQVLGL